VTWLKLSDDFHDQCAALSDAAYRTHVEALGWVMRRETGGSLSRRDVLRCIETEDPDAAIEELLAGGFWKRVPSPAASSAWSFLRSFGSAGLGVA